MALNAVDNSLLVPAIDNAKNIDLKSDLLDNCEKLSEKIENIENDQEEASRFFDTIKMERVLEKANAIGLGSKTIVHCSHLLERVYRIKEESSKALNTLVMAHIDAVIKASGEIEYSDDKIEELKRIKSLPQSELLKNQLRAAMKNKDFHRIIWLEITMKTWLFKEHGRNFSLEKFSNLKSPEEWAKEKWLSFNKKQLASGFMSYTTKGIHSSLTIYQDTFNKRQYKRDAVEMFNDVRDFMGTRNTASGMPEDHAFGAISKACADKNLRDELFCQIIKQINNNPDQETENLGWDLMYLCLNSFPPTDDFENYLEVWLREKAPEPMEAYIVALHRRLFANKSGSSNVVSISQFKKILSDKNTEGFNEPRVTGPSWLDLLSPYTNIEKSTLKRTREKFRRITKAQKEHSSKSQKPPVFTQNDVDILPDGWSCHLDEDTGKKIYTHIETGKTQSDIPMN